jgi:hypothetical protein
MAKLTEMPQEAIIAGFKGTVDYYLWMGIPVARSWPRSPGPRRAPAVEAQWPPFSYAAKEWSNLSVTVQAAYHGMAQTGGLDGRDLQVRGYLSGLYRYPLP